MANQTDVLVDAGEDVAALVLLRVRSQLPSLQPGEAKVAQVILGSPKVVIYSSVSEIAEQAQTSTATVVRCAQRLGFKGFHALKIALAQQLAAEPQSGETATPEGVLAEVCAAGARCVRDAGALVPVAAFNSVVGRIAAARRLLIAGIGTSAPLCQDAAYRFSAVGVLAEARSDVHEQAVVARLLDERDVCLVVSHTGATRETVEIAEGARTTGATIVAITSFERSPLTDLCDEVIVAGNRELSVRFEAMASRLAHLAILDALVVAVAEIDESRSAQALQAYRDVLAEHRF